VVAGGTPYARALLPGLWAHTALAAAVLLFT